MKKQGLLLILSGPSGSGKGTIVEQLKAKDDFALSISATTRAPREYEQDGVHYFFRTREEFEKMIANQELLEWAEFCGNCYGTPRAYVTEQLQKGQNVILEIEVQGALQVKKLYPEGVLIFLVPPNLEELEYVQDYDYVVINDTVPQATQDILDIVHAESMRCSRNKEIKKVFKGEI